MPISEKRPKRPKRNEKKQEKTKLGKILQKRPKDQKKFPKTIPFQKMTKTGENGL